MQLPAIPGYVISATLLYLSTTPRNLPCVRLRYPFPDNDMFCALLTDPTIFFRVALLRICFCNIAKGAVTFGGFCTLSPKRLQRGLSVPSQTVARILCYATMRVVTLTILTAPPGQEFW